MIRLYTSHKGSDIRRWSKEYLEDHPNDTLVKELYDNYFGENRDCLPNLNVYYFMSLNKDEMGKRRIYLRRDKKRSPRTLPMKNPILHRMENGKSVLGAELKKEMVIEHEEGNNSKPFDDLYNSVADNRYIIRDDVYYFFRYSAGRYYVKRDTDKSPKLAVEEMI